MLECMVRVFLVSDGGGIFVSLNSNKGSCHSLLRRYLMQTRAV